MSRTARGFTLVEVLVSSAVLSLLLVILAQVASMVSNAWSGGNGRAERRQSGRALVDFIGQELKSAALPVDLLAPATGPDLQFVVNPASVPAAFRSPHALFWQAPMATDTSAGDMAVFGYFIRWDTAGGRPRPSLCRLFLNPSSPDYKIYTEPASWVTEDLLDKAAPADEANAYRGLFEENVIGFWARCLDGQGKKISQSGATPGTYDSRVGYVEQVEKADGTQVAVTRAAPVLPASVEISMVVLDARAAASLTSSMVSTIQSAAATSADDETPAQSFITRLQASPSMRPLLQGMSASSVRVYLENAP